MGVGAELTSSSKKKNMFYLFYLTCMSALPVSMYSTCMPGACRGLKRTLESLALEFQMVVRHDASVGS